MSAPDKTRISGIARGVALASALFVLLVGGLLVHNQISGKVAHLVNSKEVVRLHDELRKQPKDEDLKKQIRVLDLELRQNTFYRLQLSHLGTRAALVGVALFLLSAHYVRTSRRRSPDPMAWGARDAATEKKSIVYGRAAVASTCALLGFVAVLASTRGVRLPAPAEPEKVPMIGTSAAPVFQSLEELRHQWPSFRGADGSGVALGATMPTSWDTNSGANIRWKSPLPMHGMSSPIVWSNHVFLTGADKASNCVFCFDADSGKLLWLSAVKVPGGARPPSPEVGEETGFAAPTAATDGQRVYAIFADGEIAAFDMAGKQVWARNIGPLENSYGYAASLALFQDRLLIQIDRGSVDEKLSKAVALDTKTGRDLWSVKRDVAGSWASPVVVAFGGATQLVMCANPFVIAYNPLDGKEAWRVKCVESDVAPSPVAASNLIIAVAPNNAIVGVKPGETGAVWRAEDGVPDATSPVVVGDRFFIVNSEGLLTCFDVNTGKVVWQHEYEDRFYASPVVAGRTMMLLGRKGRAYFLEAGDALKEIGKAEVGEECNASPAPVGRRIYIRGKDHLFCMEQSG